MPRLPPALIRQAASLDSHLPRLLRECKDLGSARRELRWLKEGVEELDVSSEDRQRRLRSWVQRRSRGEPVQYILGNQPFGNLDIMVEPGVLIPRPETETYVEQLCRTVFKLSWTRKSTLRVADFCTGTGCIALGIASQLRSVSNSAGLLQVNGYDISSAALSLANRNLQHNRNMGVLGLDSNLDIAFNYLDVLDLAQRSVEDIEAQLSLHFDGGQPDIIVSNPPYIAPEHYKPGATTSRSVRLYEPELALVPPDHLVFPEVCRADQFYAALLNISLACRPKILLMEVGDTAQALRVWHMCKQWVANARLPWTRIEIWKDNMSVVHHEDDVLGMRTSDDIQSRAAVLWLNEASGSTCGAAGSESD